MLSHQQFFYSNLSNYRRGTHSLIYGIFLRVLLLLATFSSTRPAMILFWCLDDNICRQIHEFLLQVRDQGITSRFRKSLLRRRASQIINRLLDPRLDVILQIRLHEIEVICGKFVVDVLEIDSTR